MRKYEWIIVEAELLALPPETVRARLMEYASKAERSDLNPALDEAAEEALRLRRDPLIDLSLSQYARYIEVVKPIFHGNPPGSALRLAALSNQNFTKAFLCYFPSELFHEKDEGLAVWLIDAPDIEIEALFSNPTLNSRFLSALLNRENDFGKISDSRLIDIVNILRSNPRMSAERDERYMDGFAEYEHRAVFDAGWTLSERVDPTKQWASALGWLYSNLLMQCFSIKNPLAVAERWRPLPIEAEVPTDDEPNAMACFLTNHERVRWGLARLATKHNEQLLTELLTHEDRAFRAAAYIDLPLTQDMINTALERDGELVFQNAIDNNHLWRSAGGREMLRSLAWSVNDADGSGHLDAPNQFNHTETRLERLHPAWFKDEPAKPDDDEGFDPDSAPATRADLAQAFVLLQNEMEKNKPGKTLDWVFWITVFIAIYLFFKLS